MTFTLAVFGADDLRQSCEPASDDGNIETYDPQGNLVEHVDDNYGWPIDANTYYPSGVELSGFPTHTSASLTLTAIDGVAFGGKYGYYNPEFDLYLLGSRYYDAYTGRFLNRDTIGYQGGPNLYAYCGNNPITRSDPEGTDWFDYLSDFAAGAGSSLTFGATDRINSWLGDSAYVNQNSGSYSAGVWTEVGVETAATLGSGGLKHLVARSIEDGLANGFTRAEVMRNVRVEGLKFIKKDAGEIAHHANPLFGHPFGRVPTVFPTGGLSPSIANGAWNIERLSSTAAHVARHNWVKGLDKIAPMIVNPATTSSRALRNLYHNLDGQ